MEVHTHTPSIPSSSSTTSHSPDIMDSQNVMITGIELDTPRVDDLRPDRFKVPLSVNIIALREAFLTQAPFVSRGQKTLWRRMVDGQHFQHILGCLYSQVCSAIGDNGALDVVSLRDMECAEMKCLARNFSEIFFFFSRFERDCFLPKIAELAVFMLVHTLHTAVPKHYRMYNSVRFREILLDFFVEVFGGLRLTSCPGADWLFQDAQQVPIFLSHPDSKTDADTSVSVQKSRFALRNSPLVAMQMGNSSNPGVARTFTLSHMPNRLVAKYFQQKLCFFLS